MTILGWFHVGAAALALATGAVPEATRDALEHAMHDVVAELEAAWDERPA